MTGHLIGPEYVLPLAGREHVLPGDFATLRAVQHAFREDLIDIQSRILTMRTDEIALLLATALKADVTETGQLILDEVGVTEPAYQMLKAHLMAWLHIAMAPKADREQRKKAMGELIGELGRPPASRGKRTRKSA